MVKRSLILPAALLALTVLAGCSSSTLASDRPAPEPMYGPEALPPSPADVRFMADMIGHHSQAILISRWAPDHGAGAAIRRLAERIAVGQQDEIAIMRRWLRDHDDIAAADTTRMSGMDHSMHMPGMLTAGDLARLDSASGPEFDRLFLTFMIRHHQGALAMVTELFGSQGAAQNDTVFRLASDVYAEQSTEIGRMQSMLDALPSQGSSP